MRVIDVIDLLNTGKIVTIEFIKRTDGDLRRMVCRKGEDPENKLEPTRHVNWWKSNLVPVYDEEKKQMRSIPIEGIRKIEIEGSWQEVTTLPFWQVLNKIEGDTYRVKCRLSDRRGTIYLPVEPKLVPFLLPSKDYERVLICSTMKN